MMARARSMTGISACRHLQAQPGLARPPGDLCGTAVADVRHLVTLSLLTDFENYTIFKPGDHNTARLDTLLNQVAAWSTALAPLRTTSPAPA